MKTIDSTTIRGVMLAIMTMTISHSAQAQDRRSTMEVTRKADQKTTDGSPEYFTGKVTISGQFQRPSPSRVGGATVHFEPGARTAWHTHPLGQTLIVTEGVGWTQVEGGPTIEFQAGDVLWCPPDRKHWHGATPTQAMTHIAIQESLNGSPVKWMEQVTDAQYRAGPGTDSGKP
ncbi:MULTISPECIES: cupin domain-containing protein [unclassified Sphingomonas]|uniref:(R)-mandelonitrile lyase n=1 Tax=unclassified Sphingomonas TaxID=196159 RepID=UPI002AA2A8B5|nr:MULTISPECIES: cupin domain-containing protein [unclassified Sphingomonas]